MKGICHTHRKNRASIEALGLTLLLILLAQALPAQDISARGELFAPFVSRIQTEETEGKITLSWKDSTDVSGGRYLIYRHTEEITERNFKDAEFLEAVNQGTESYTDIPTLPGSYYYAVVIEAADQTLYDIFIPYRNKTTRAFTVAEKPSESQLATKISDIAARAEGNQVIISFDSSRPNRELILYRGLQPFNSKNDLDPQKIVAALNDGTSPVQDYPVPGIPYYYALGDKNLIQEGTHTITRGQNSTLTAVQIAITSQHRVLPERTALRSLPLPALLMSSRVTTGDPLAAPYIPPPEPMPLSQETKEALDNLMNRFDLPRAPEARPQVLAIDRSNTDEPLDITLGSILEGPFASQDWKTTEQQLTNYLGLSLSRERESRARFYLAQTLYFQGKMRNAFLEVLMAERDYPQQSRSWQNYILASLAR